MLLPLVSLLFLTEALGSSIPAVRSGIKPKHKLYDQIETGWPTRSPPRRGEHKLSDQIETGWPTRSPPRRGEHKLSDQIETGWPNRPQERGDIKPNSNPSDQVGTGWPHRPQRRGGQEPCCKDVLSPKFFIISMFVSEADAWYGDKKLDLLGRNITVPGLSPLFPEAHCNPSGEVCQLTTGEGQINAASSITALWSSGCFDLKSTYFMVAGKLDLLKHFARKTADSVNSGIAGVNPHVATTGSVTFAKYAVQFDLQYEFAETQVPSNDTSGWFPQDSDYPDENKPIDYPGAIYGTEAFELNNNLKKRAVSLAKRAKLHDSVPAQQYRAKYGYAPANQPPQVVECDTGTSNNYWSGSVIGNAYNQYTLLLTNGSGLYCATQQEDNATLEALLRGALAGKVDFDRIIIMRTASDFDRAPPDESEVYHLLYAPQAGFGPSIKNIYLAGIEIVHDVVNSWEEVYAHGIKPDNYVGDLFNSLGSEIPPNIGTSSIYIN